MRNDSSPDAQRLLDWFNGLADHPALARAVVALLDTRDFLESEEPELGRSVAFQLERLIQADVPELAALPAHRHLPELRQQVRHLLLESNRAAKPAGRLRVSAQTARVPTMLSPETMEYYCWLGTQLSGLGDIVEFGVWLGSSTRCLCEGLARAQPTREREPRLHAYDAFTWQPWMLRFLTIETRAEGEGRALPRAGEDFLDRYERNVRDFRDRIAVNRCTLGPDEREQHSALRWDAAQPVELVVYDMGPDADLLDGIWQSLVSHFIPGRTLIVMNEYGKLNSEPIWRFCSKHAGQLVPLHKPCSSTKAFLYERASAIGFRGDARHGTKSN